MPAIIHKKVWQEYFEKILSGKKTFEWRLADFEVNDGDVLVLEEWDKDRKVYTGRKTEVIATMILKTKGQAFWSPEDVEKFGFQIIQFQPAANSASAAFYPKIGQVDYTHARYAPVINCVVQYQDYILLVQRSASLRFYPNVWNGISGFLDDERSIEDKAREELREELGIASKDIVSIRRGDIFDQEEEQYRKTWIVHPILVEVKTNVVKLDWEAQRYQWVRPEDIKTFDLLPGFDRVLQSFSLGSH
ncbi:MAG: DUF3850 domain-containing protein [Patescibacteria group bacterium]